MVPQVNDLNFSGRTSLSDEIGCKITAAPLTKFSDFHGTSLASLGIRINSTSFLHHLIYCCFRMFILLIAVGSFIKRFFGGNSKRWPRACAMEGTRYLLDTAAKVS